MFRFWKKKIRLLTPEQSVKPPPLSRQVISSAHRRAQKVQSEHEKKDRQSRNKR
jgi:hypothetical protein